LPLGWLASPSANNVVSGEIPWATQCVMPAPSPASGSDTTKTKLRVPSGAFDHDNCGETFSPLQFAPRAGMSPTGFGRSWPSLKVVDSSVKTSAAWAARAPNAASVKAVVNVKRSAFAGAIVIGPLHHQTVDAVGRDQRSRLQPGA
jgi:hypothetical protein